jgi:hypothetical protein
MLTEYDRVMMAHDVSGIIDDSTEKCTIRTPKPYDQQPYYDKILHEFRGAIEYDTLLDVPVDPYNMPFYSLPNDISVSGDKLVGRCLFHIPLTYMYNGTTVDIVLSEQTEILYSGYIWRIESIKNRIGEYTLSATRQFGDVSQYRDKP